MEPPKSDAIDPVAQEAMTDEKKEEIMRLAGAAAEELIAKVKTMPETKDDALLLEMEIKWTLRCLDETLKENPPHAATKEPQ